jgi:Fe-S-cluster containining protein
MTPLALSDTFRFSCSKRVPCFNECCKELNQYLTPYDILRLKNRLDLSSALFLQRYTVQHTGLESGLPIITLKPNYDKELKCPFVTSKGCGVYEDRPSSCRAYPLARIASRSRETGRINEQYLLLQESHCRGFEQEQSQTVRGWIKSQELAIYNQMNDMMLEIISLKNRLMPDQLDSKASLAFRTACYDLDKFRTDILEKGIVKDQELDSGLLEAIKNDDVALLRFGLQWIKGTLFSKK